MTTYSCTVMTKLRQVNDNLSGKCLRKNKK